MRALARCGVVAVAACLGACGGGDVFCEGEPDFFAPSLDGVAVPDDGATIPVNGLLHVVVQAFGAPVRASVRADVDSDERTLDVDEIGPVLRVNLQDLAAETSYTATLEIDAADSFTGEDIVRELHFATSAARDDAPPAFSGAATVAVEREPSGAAQCGGLPGTLVNITPPAIDDDSDIAGVELFAVDRNGLRTLLQFALADAAETIVDRRETGGDASYQLVAVDVAGHESAPLDVDVNVSGCASTSTSAGGPLVALFALALGRSRWRRA